MKTKTIKAICCSIFVILVLMSAGTMLGIFYILIHNMEKNTAGCIIAGTYIIASNILFRLVLIYGLKLVDSIELKLIRMGL